MFVIYILASQLVPEAAATVHLPSVKHDRDTQPRNVLHPSDKPDAH